MHDVNHMDVDRENVIIAHDHAPLDLFAWLKATASTHAKVQTHVHRTNINDAWTGLSCRSHQSLICLLNYLLLNIPVWDLLYWALTVVYGIHHLTYCR